MVFDAAAPVQAKLGEFASRSGGRLPMHRQARSLPPLRARGDTNGLAAIIAMEGLQALQGSTGSIRCSTGVIASADEHFFDNEVGGSSTGEIKNLTD
jgi:hypothetical protein